LFDQASFKCSPNEEVMEIIQGGSVSWQPGRQRGLGF